jgi:uncharacterized protein YndB with AHSA1/START domain
MLNNPDGRSVEVTDRILTITRTFNAPRELVFNSWIEREHIKRWWGPEGFEMTSCEMDVRPGGQWRYCIRSPEGRDYWRSGEYREVVPPERLVFTHVTDDPFGEIGHTTLVEIILTEVGSRTLMFFRQGEFDTIASCESHRGGWGSCFDRFESYLEQKQI